MRNWYNPNLDPRKWFVAASLIAMITTIGVMIVTSLSVASRARAGHPWTSCWSPLATWYLRQGGAGADRRHPAGNYRAGDWYLGHQILLAGSLLLFYFTMVIYGLSLVGFAY